MTDTQMLIVALPSAVSVIAVLVGILINNSRFCDLNGRMSEMRSELRTSISDLRSHMDGRFDDMRDMWRGELRRVEEVVDARLKHVE